MARQILIATHASMAAGIKDSLGILAGNTDNITVINCFTEVPNPKPVIEEFFNNLPEEDELIVMTDLMAGSVNQMFMNYVPQRKFHLITGTNLPMALKSLCALRRRSPWTISWSPSPWPKRRSNTSTPRWPSLKSPTPTTICSKPTPTCMQKGESKRSLLFLLCHVDHSPCWQRAVCIRSGTRSITSWAGPRITRRSSPSMRSR